MEQPTHSSEPSTISAAAAPETKYAYWEPYKALSETFRNWLIAYGIAIPYLFVSEKGFGEYARQVPEMRWIVILFFSGVLLQLIQLAFAKYVMMILYTGEDVKGFRESATHRFADRLSERSWPYVATDVGTIACYAIGTYLLFFALITVQPTPGAFPKAGAAGTPAASATAKP